MFEYKIHTIPILMQKTHIFTTHISIDLMMFRPNDLEIRIVMIVKMTKKNLPKNPKETNKQTNKPQPTKQITDCLENG
jgi:hypothetical protein